MQHLLAWAAALMSAKASAAAAATMPTKPTPTLPADALRERIGKESYRCTQEGGTETPFVNEYWNHHALGIYVDVVSGEALFSSQDKFDSGTGWPSFSRPLTSLKTVRDSSLGMQRTEVRSPEGNSHLGHLFDDGPGPGGQRFCINSASLRFVAVEDMRKEGYGAYLFAFADAKKWEVATLAGGCFWGMEKMFDELPGVLETQVGYAGGDLTRATYADVTTGTTRNAEALQVLFDPSKVSYSQLLLRFFSIHDPTTRNQQGHDRGTQYRSAIYFASAAQQKAAAEVVARVNKSGRWKKPVVTELAAFAGFVRAEPMHQKYLARTPHGYSCHVDRHLEF